MGIPSNGGYVCYYPTTYLLDYIFKTCTNLLYYAIKFYIVRFIDKHNKKYHNKIKD